MTYSHHLFNIEINTFLNILPVSYWLDKWDTYKMLDLKTWDEVELIRNATAILLSEGPTKYLLPNPRQKLFCYTQLLQIQDSSDSSRMSHSSSIISVPPRFIFASQRVSVHSAPHKTLANLTKAWWQAPFYDWLQLREAENLSSYSTWIRLI